MKDGDESGSGVLENLTAAQQAVLVEALTEVKLQVFQHTVKRLKAYLAILLVAVGAETFVLGWGIRRDTVEAAGAALAKDDEIRPKVERASAQEVAKAIASASTATASVKEIEAMRGRAEEQLDLMLKSAESASALRLAALNATLDELNRMLAVAVDGDSGQERKEAEVPAVGSAQ